MIPDVTIVVALHNSEADLPSFLGFLKNQTFQNFHLLFVDDFSTDRTVPLLKKLLSNGFCSYEVLEKKENGGAGKARDYALDFGSIQTKYILFLDPDDEPLPNFLGSLVKKADETNADITFCGYERISRADGRVITREMVNNPDLVTDLYHCYVIPYLNPAPWNKLFKTSVVKDARFINRGGGEDEMFFLKVLPRCSVLSFINKVLYHYYVHANSVISSTNNELLFATRQGYSEVKSFYDTHGVAYEKFHAILEASVFVRFGIGATTRFCLAHPKQTHCALKENKLFFNKNFPDWFKTPFLSFRVSLKGGFKTLMVWRCKWLFKFGFFRVFLMEYKVFTSIFKKDIKW